MRRRKPSTSERQPRISTAPRQDFFSYHASRQAGKPDSTARQSSPISIEKSSWTWNRIITGIVIAVLVVCAAYTTTLTTQPRFVIDTQPQAKPLRAEQTYQQTAQEYFEESVFNKTKLTINSAEIERKISQAFPELRDVQLSLPIMGHRPTVSAIAETPALLVATKTGVYVVGESGKVFAKTTEVAGAGGLTIPTVQDEADLTITPGKGVLSTQDVTFITTIVKQFESQNIAIDSLTLPPLASELDVRISGQPYMIKFSLLTDPRIAYGQFAALKKKLDAEGTIPKEYIDSRVEERVYFR